MYRLFFKRFFDIVISGVAMILLSPLYLLLTLYVAVFMGLPVLFSQERIGMGEKPFKLYKFRSMTNKKDEEGNLLPESERLTKAGIFLRNSSLDELPELWSIFIGKMSIVGPRPMPTYYGPYFLPEERKRHTVRGGLIPPDNIKVIFTTFKILFLRVEEDYGTCERPHLNVYRKDMKIDNN